ncbi:ferritin-like domain-containing protein [Pseudothauera rhizosphaerae]|uniref:Ferritin n=1 Tax=Pseudothauera rhizosphaerae TaxID=2565932 RepID=A0A4S4ATN1_9RHOO|nr:ferritin [Pseudothauera rhizosphaerae]THF63261.1 ferritin [Pseudothauera rhizosphaerae]
MLNYDESILRMRIVDPRAPFPVLHQAVRIALFDEYAARAFYKRVVESFGPRPPFANIANAEERHIAALGGVCERYGIPRPLDPFPTETTVSPSWLANCQRAVAGEVANLRLYTYLLAQVPNPDVRRVFEQLQAATLENHLPAFQQAAAEAWAQERYHVAHGIPPQQAYVRHGPLSDFIERALAQLGPQAGLLGTLLRHVHPALLAGMAVGGTGAYALKGKLRRTRKEN